MALRTARSRRLLIKADEHLDDRGRSRLVGLPHAGDPRGEVRTAWHAKEVVRSVYGHHNPALALGFVTRLGHHLQDNDCAPEVRQLGRHDRAGGTGSRRGTRPMCRTARPKRSTT